MLLLLVCVWLQKRDDSDGVESDDGDGRGDSDEEDEDSYGPSSDDDDDNDDEETLLEQEEHEKSVDHSDEIAALQKEGSTDIFCRVGCKSSVSYRVIICCVPTTVEFIAVLCCR